MVYLFMYCVCNDAVCIADYRNVTDKTFVEGFILDGFYYTDIHINYSEAELQILGHCMQTNAVFL